MYLDLNVAAYDLETFARLSLMFVDQLYNTTTQGHIHVINTRRTVLVTQYFYQAYA